MPLNPKSGQAKSNDPCTLLVPVAVSANTHLMHRIADNETLEPVNVYPVLKLLGRGSLKLSEALDKVAA